MQNLKNKSKISAIPFVILLTFTATIVTLPIVNAHDPAWEVPTWAYISVSPNPIGVNQPALIVIWLNAYPPTASGANGDRWDGFTVEVTKPDGTKETLGPFTSDPVGSAYSQYTPTQVGEYSFVFHFPGDTLTGEPFPPDWTPFSFGAESIGDIYLESTSDPVTLTVQMDPIEGYAETPLPEGYWERPIYGANRDWWKISGNWLNAGDNPGRFNRYSNGPESAHILWAKQYWDGGIMGGQFGSIGYYTGMSYESFGLSPPIILNGRLYYNVETPPVYGWYCLDLYTGEKLYFHNTTGPVTGITGTGFDESGAISRGALSFGQIYDYESPNQHGGFPYLWAAGQVAGFFAAPSTTWDMFDAFTGNYICTIENVSATGTTVFGKEGSILRYSIAGTPNPMGPFFPDVPPYYLRCWNTSRAIWFREFTTNTYWMWRPYLNYTFDGNNGFSLNVSIPNVQGSILAVVEDEYVIGGTSGTNNPVDPIVPGNLWALSLVKGQEGTLLWNRTFTPPQTVVPPTAAGGFFNFGGMQGPTLNVENSVFYFTEGTTRRIWCYDLDTGLQIWGPTEPGPQWNYYGMSTSVAYGKLFSYGYGGKLVAYDIRTGEEVWTWRSGTLGFETPYENVPLQLGCIADNKLYMYSSEHSPTMPLRRDAYLWCIDTETGEEIWKIQCWGNNPAIADGYIVTLDSFDNRIYCYGKGPSAITVTGPESVQPLGTPVLIRGMVTDQSPGAKGTPAISDADQQLWMEYLYQQRPRPKDAEGVEVVLTTLDPNHNFYEIGRTTSDMNGNYGLMWEPPVPGQYQIIATFEGSAAYGGSDATTYIGVIEAPSPAQPIEPEPIPAAPAPAEPAPVESSQPAAAFAPTEPTPVEPIQTAEAPLITTEIAIVAVVAVTCIIGIVTFWALRKRK